MAHAGMITATVVGLIATGLMAVVSVAQGSLGAGALLSSSVSARPQLPHIVFFMADDLGNGNVGFRRLAGDGASEVRTPTIDKLARDGVVLERMYSSAHSLIVSLRQASSARQHTESRPGHIQPCHGRGRRNRYKHDGARECTQTRRLSNRRRGQVGRWNGHACTYPLRPRV